MCPFLLLLVLLISQSTTTSAPPKPTTPNGSVETPRQSVDAAWGILKYGLEDRSYDRRAKAAHALALMQNNARAEEMADKALADPNPDVRASAATALGQMNAKNSIPKLHNALNDTVLKVVIAASNSLYIYKDPAAYEIYYALLTGERKQPGLVKSQMDTLKDKKQMEKLAFETGIGFIPFGGMGYEAYKTITHDDSSVVRAAAAEKLATDPDSKTTEALAKACSDKQWRVRVAVVEAIAKRGDQQLLFSLTPLLYDNTDDVRFETAAAVIRLSTAASKLAPKHAARRKRT